MNDWPAGIQENQKSRKTEALHFEATDGALKHQ